MEVLEALNPPAASVVWSGALGCSGTFWGCAGGFLQGAAAGFSAGLVQNGWSITSSFMQAASVQNQAQLIVDTLVDRMYELVELGRVDCDFALHKEIEEWISEDNKGKDIDVLSVENH